MKRAAVFFDRDNTLIANDGYLGDPRGVVLVDGAPGAVARARAMGYAVVVFSNQSGVARGMFGEEAVHAVNHRLDELLLDDNTHAVIDRHEFCPYHPEATDERYRQDSDLRKPKPGMILQAERQLALDLTRSWVIGDAPRDIDAGKTAGCRTILFKSGSLTESAAAREAGDSAPDFEVTSLAEAMEIIARHRNPETVTTPSSHQPVAEHALSASSASANEPDTAPASSIPIQPEIARREAAAQAAETEQGVDTTAPVTPDSEPTSTPTDPVRLAPVVQRQTTAAEIEPEDEPDLPRGKSRTEILLGQILEELRRAHEHPENDFSVSKLMAGVIQVVALAAVFLAYIKVKEPYFTSFALLTAIFLQAFTIALLLMGRQK